MLAPEAWPEALGGVTEALGAVGAAYILSNKSSGEVEWASFPGPAPSANLITSGRTRLSAPFRPLCHAAPSGSWVKLSDRLPKSTLGADEWYNDFVLKCGVGDILGARLFENETHAAIVGIHFGVFQSRSGPPDTGLLKELLRALSQAARLHVELRHTARKSLIALLAFEQLAGGIIITDSEERASRLNRAAEHILNRGDGLVTHEGELRALRLFEHRKLASFISEASLAKPGAAGGRMLIGRGRSSDALRGDRDIDLRPRIVEVRRRLGDDPRGRLGAPCAYRTRRRPNLRVLTCRKPSCGGSGRGKDAPGNRRQFRGSDYNPADTAQLYL